MKNIAALFFFFFFCLPLFGQKMLLIERANRAKTTRLFIGDGLHYRLTGEGNYWYKNRITDILPGSNTLLLDNLPVKLSEIDAIRVRRRSIWRILGGTLFSGGFSGIFATSIALLYGEKEYAPLYAPSAAALGAGYFMNTKRSLKLREKHRLRIVEIELAPMLRQ
jgi:hypothetical protein